MYAQSDQPRGPGPGIQAQGFRPRDSDPGIQTQGFRPRDSDPGIQTRDSGPGFQAQKFRPRGSGPGVQVQGFMASGSPQASVERVVCLFLILKRHSTQSQKPALQGYVEVRVKLKINNS